MNFKKNIFLTLSITACTGILSEKITTFISPKSQSVNDARELVGISTFYHLPKIARSKTYEQKGNMTSTLTAQISKSFRHERITKCLFGDAVIQDSCAPYSDDQMKHNNKVTVSGSRTNDRKPNHDFLADYFGLAPDFKSVTSFRPRILNYTAHFWTHINADILYPGLFLEVSLPVTHTDWNMNTNEKIENAGTLGYEAGYKTPVTISQEKLLSSFTSFMTGSQTPQLENVIFQPLNFGKIACGKITTTRVAELRTYLGVHSDECWFFWQAGIVGGIALGTRPNAEYLFNPIIGNGHHHELGARGRLHTTIWQSENGCECVTLSAQTTITHLFSTMQQRSFDLKNKPNSRYMLAQQLTTEVNNNLATAQGISTTQFNNGLSSVINFTTFDVDVSIPYQAELTFLCSYTAANECAWEFGYSLYKRARDQLRIKNKNNFEKHTWALTGDNYLFGFIGEENNVGDLPLNTPVALNASQNSATIYNGKNFPKKGLSTNQTTAQNELITARANPEADNAAFAFAGNNQMLVNTINGNQITTSAPGVIITMDDIDIQSAQTKGFVQKIFAHMSQRFNQCARGPECFIGIGAEVDFSNNSTDDNGINCHPSFWSVWVKGGLVF